MFQRELKRINLSVPYLTGVPLQLGPRMVQPGCRHRLSVPYLTGVPLQPQRHGEVVQQHVLSVPYLTGVPLQPVLSRVTEPVGGSFSSLSNGSTSATRN